MLKFVGRVVLWVVSLVKITEIYIKNLFSYEEFEIRLDKNFNIIVGPNNAGKTNLFRVIQFMVDIIDNKLKARDIREYLYDPTKEQAEIKIWVEFDDGEKTAIRDFFECYFDKYLRELDQGIAQDKFKINDVLPEYNGPEGHYDKLILNQRVNELFVESIKHFINAFPEFLGSGVFTWKYSGEYSRTPEVNFFAEIYIEPEIINSFISTLNLDWHNSKHKEILDRCWLNMPVSVSIDITSGDLSISRDLIPPEQGSSDLENALEKSYTEFIKKIGVPFVFGLLFDNSSKIPPEMFLLFLSSFSSLITPAIRWENVREPQKTLTAKLFKQANLEIPRNNVLTLHWLLLRLFANTVVKVSEVRGYPKPSSMEFLEKYDGNGIDLANYLFYLKNASDISVRNKYIRIQEQFEQLNSFMDIKVAFDVVTVDEIPEVVIVENERQYNIQRVASGIFEVLNLLAVIYGNQEKIILLDEPALHLHPVYQKHLAKMLYTISTENQIFIITHSPYLVENLKQVHRFYKINSSTRVVRVSDHITSSDKPKFLQNDQLIRALFSNGVLLVEGFSEYVSLLPLLTKLRYPVEDYNIEIVNVGGKGRFSNYISLFKRLQIPYAVVCDGDTAFNVYEWSGDSRKFNLQSSKLPALFDALKKNDILLPEHETKLWQLLKELPPNINATGKNDVSGILEKCIKPLYAEFKDILARYYGVFAYPCWDWTDYLDWAHECQKTHKDSKTEKAWKIAQEISDGDAQEKFSDLQEFIKMFINSL